MVEKVELPLLSFQHLRNERDLHYELTLLFISLIYSSRLPVV
jgi:hypothetical protein